MQRTPAVEPITVVDLFAGCGGFTQGFHEFRPMTGGDSGPVFRSISAVEHDKAAAATYAANFGGLRVRGSLPAARVHVGDIQDWKPEGDDIDADMVVGGPPCQGFSALNRAKAGLERNSLWLEYVTAVNKIKPKIFVIENVDRFLKSAEFEDLLEEVRPGELLEDYRLVDPAGGTVDVDKRGLVSRFLLNSADYGAVQARRRAIVIGVRRDLPVESLMRYPVRTHSARPTEHARSFQSDLLDEDSRLLEPWLNVARIFEESEKLVIEGTELPDGKVYFAEADANVPGIYSTADLHIGRKPVPLSKARYRAISRGGNRNDLRDRWFTMTKAGDITIHEAPPRGRHHVQGYLSTESWDAHRSGTGDVMGRIKLDQPSVTIRTEFFKPEKGRYLHPVEDRPITHYEAARIQGFPVDFRWCGSKVQVARQIGNAVPIPLGRAIAAAVYPNLRG
jgi:DNA (cytosine-5)-methyltransferase 1